jgi:hypothetical protein
MDPGGDLSAIDPYPTGRLGFSMQERIAKSEAGGVPRGRIRWLTTTGARAAVRRDPRFELVEVVDSLTVLRRRTEPNVVPA